MKRQRGELAREHLHRPVRDERHAKHETDQHTQSQVEAVIVGAFVVYERPHERGRQDEDDVAENQDVVEGRVATAIDSVNGIDTQDLTDPRNEPPPEPTGRRPEAE